MELNTVAKGDTLQTMKTWPDGFVHCCITSPPYWSLRDYGVEGQFGLEETPEEYVEKMVEVFKEVKRILRNDGTLWLNLGDTYWGGKGKSGCTIEGHNRNIERETLQKEHHHIIKKGGVRPQDRKHEYIKPKDLVGIPWMVALALRKDGWYLRSDIIWAKGVSFCSEYSGGCMPEPVEDRPSKSHEYMFLLSKDKNYYFDIDAIREEYVFMKKRPDWLKARKVQNTEGTKYDGSENYGKGVFRKYLEDPSLWNSGRNPRSVWTVNVEPNPEAHFATFPEKLVEPCILSGTSEKGCCPNCGAFWKRNESNWNPSCTCGVENTLPCVVLDPFMGSGTVAFVARNLGRKYIGVELNPEYHKIIDRKLQQQVLWT